MINANELRLGNIVSYKGIIGKVTWIQQNCITIEYPRQDDLSNGSMVSPELLDGVIITRKILDVIKELEFKNNAYYFKSKYWEPINKISINYFDDNFYNTNYFIVNMSGIRINIGYIHELQNLYQVLSQKELDTTKIFD